MYGVANRIDPDGYRRLARAVFAEMSLSGFTAVGEFHYLHHAPGGERYGDPNQMSWSLIEAARDAGIRMTLLDTCYLSGGFGSAPEHAQRRFSDGTVDAWSERVGGLQCADGFRLGAAVHSVRAVPPAAITRVADMAETMGWPLHAHVSEQQREVEESVAWFGRTPMTLLADCGAAVPGFTAVHGTHLTPPEVALLGRAGAGCCLCPTTERDLGDGIGPAADLQRAGVHLSLGTDSHAVIEASRKSAPLRSTPGSSQSSETSSCPRTCSIWRPVKG
jgi:formiminoglutamate deiminase